MRSGRINHPRATSAASDATRLLESTTEILGGAGLSFWLDQGTLLGAIRDNALLPWETDIDLSMWEADFHRVLEYAGAFAEHNIRVEHHANRKSIYLMLRRRSSIFVDIAGHRQVGDVVYKRFAQAHTSVWKRRAKRILDAGPPVLRDAVRSRVRAHSSTVIDVPIPAHWFADFREHEFLAVKGLRVPADAEAYLEYKYGPDWRVPRRDWDFYTEDGAIVHAKNHVEHG